MALTFQQTDEVASCPISEACAPLTTTISSQASDFAMRPGGTPGVTAESFDIPAGSSRYGVFFQSDDVGQADWPAGNWTIRLNVSSAQNNTAWDGVWVCRVDNACATVASVGSETTSVDISAGGVFSKTVSGTATTGTTTDAVYIVCRFTNSHSMTARTVGVLPNETVASPIPEPEAVTVATGTASNITDTAATLNGDLTQLSGATSADVWFEWRPVGATTWNTTPVQTLTTEGPFSANLTGLTATTDYEFRAQGATTNATSTGTTATFTTSAPPTVISGTVTQGGTAVGSAPVTIVNSGTDTIQAELTTAADGTFSYETYDAGPFHVLTKHDDGTTKYNAESYHSIQ